MQLRNIKYFSNIVNFMPQCDPTMMYFMEKIQLLQSNEKAQDAIKRITNSQGASNLNNSQNEKNGDKSRPLYTI